MRSLWIIAEQRITDPWAATRWWRHLTEWPPGGVAATAAAGAGGGVAAVGWVAAGPAVVEDGVVHEGGVLVRLTVYGLTGYGLTGYGWWPLTESGSARSVAWRLRRRPQSLSRESEQRVLPDRSVRDCQMALHRNTAINTLRWC